ncbi:MAG: anti-sigma factor family protein [Bacillota bacterium]
MDCQRASDMMMDYFDKALNEIEEKELLQHIQSCKACMSDFKIMKGAFAEIEQLVDLEVPVGFTEEIMAKIDLEYYKPVENKSRQKIWTSLFMILTVTCSSVLWYIYYGPSNLHTSYHVMGTVENLMNLFYSFKMLFGSGIKILTSSMVTLLKACRDLLSIMKGRAEIYVGCMILLCTVFGLTQYSLVKITMPGSTRGGKMV